MEDNIQTELKDIGLRVLVKSTGANEIHRQPFVNMVMNPGFHKKAGNVAPPSLAEVCVYTKLHGVTFQKRGLL
jgi:hypothetical protein